MTFYAAHPLFNAASYTNTPNLTLIVQNKYYACSSLHANSVTELQHYDIQHKISILPFSSLTSI